MSRIGARLVLLAYPRSFRREFGDDVLQSIADLRRHAGISRLGLFRRIGIDVARTAPRMRVESLMKNHKPAFVAGVLSVGLFAALVGSPTFYLMIACLAVVLVVVARSGDRPIKGDPTQGAHWYRWLGAGAASFAVGVVAAVIDGPEFSEVGWTIWALSWSAAIVLAVYGLVLAATRSLHRTVTSTGGPG